MPIGMPIGGWPMPIGGCICIPMPGIGAMWPPLNVDDDVVVVDELCEDVFIPPPIVYMDDCYEELECDCEIPPGPTVELDCYWELEAIDCCMPPGPVVELDCYWELEAAYVDAPPGPTVDIYCD